MSILTALDRWATRRLAEMEQAEAAEAEREREKAAVAAMRAEQAVQDDPFGGAIEALGDLGGRLERLEARKAAINAGYDGEALTNLEAFMSRNGIGDYTQAISQFERLNPPPPPSTSSPRYAPSPQPQPLADPALLFNQDYDGWLNAMIPAALAEARGQTS